MTPLPSTHPGRPYAVAAVVVTAPRLALAFLEADGIVVPAQVRIALLAVSSVSTAVALTGGAAYLAYASGRASHRRRILAAFWIVALICSSALIAPAIAAGLPRSALASVLPTPARQWLWAACAVLAVDVVAAGTMFADASHRRDADERLDQHRRELDEVESQRDAARAALAQATSDLRAPSVDVRAPHRIPGAPDARCCATCGRREFHNQQTFAAHLRWCGKGRNGAAQAVGGGAPAPAATPGPESEGAALSHSAAERGD